MMCIGLSVRVYMPGRCLTGSSPFRTRMEPSEYSVLGLIAIAAHCKQGRQNHWISTQPYCIPDLTNRQASEFRYIRRHVASPSAFIHHASFDLRRGHRRAVDGHPARLWLVAATHHPKSALEPGKFCLGTGGTKPGVGLFRNLRGHGG